MKKGKKLVSAVLVLFMMMAMLAGCGGGSSDEGTSGDESSEERKVKDTLVYAQSADVYSMDPRIGKETVAVQTTGNIYDTLFRQEPDNSIIPWLATDYEQEDDVTYLIHLRDDVKFHDGSDFTAVDAKDSLERASVAPAVEFILGYIDHVDVVDDYTIRMVTKYPYAPAIRNLSHNAAAITSKAYMEENGEDILLTQPMGTGPYKFVEWQQGDHVTLERFDDYWAGPAPMKNVIMRVIPESSQRTIALENGEVDIAYDILPADVDMLNEVDGIQCLSEQGLMCYYVGMNYQNKYLSDWNVRQAIRLAIDAEPMLESVMYGKAVLANSTLADGCFGFQEDDPPLETNIEEAKKLMEEAGYSDGIKLTITVPDYQEKIEMCTVMQSQLKEIGIDLAVDVVEQSTFVDTVNNGKHELCFMNWTTTTADADFAFYAMYNTDCWGSQGGRFFGEIPGVDELLDQARAEMDEDARYALYGEIQDAVNDYAVDRPLVWTYLNVGISDKVEGFEIYPHTHHKLYEVKVYE